MCNIWFTSHIYIIRSGVCQFIFYIMSLLLHSYYASFYPNKRETICDRFTPGHIDKKVWHNMH